MNYEINELLNRFNHELKSLKLNTAHCKIQKIEDLKDWSDDPGLGVDIRFFSPLVNKDLKFIYKDKLIEKPPEDDYDTFVNCDRFNDVYYLLSIAVDIILLYQNQNNDLEKIIQQFKKLNVLIDDYNDE